MEHIQYIGIPLCAACEENDEDHILFLSYHHCPALLLCLCVPCLVVLACFLALCGHKEVLVLGRKGPDDRQSQATTQTDMAVGRDTGVNSIMSRP